MTTLKNEEGKQINYATSTKVFKTTTQGMYAIDMPTVICSSEKDAEYIQQELNTYVANLIKSVLNDK